MEIKSKQENHFLYFDAQSPVQCPHLYSHCRHFHTFGVFLHIQVQPVSASLAAIAGRLNSLVAQGSTALGPALVVAAAMASGSARSEVVVCTDGEPNSGLGSSERPGALEFYRKVGLFARQAEANISFITIEGQNCALNLLAACAEQTGGAVNTINPLELERQIRGLSQNPCIATDVEVGDKPNAKFGVDSICFGLCVSNSLF